MTWSQTRTQLAYGILETVPWVWLSKKSKVFCFAFVLYSQVHSRSWDTWALWWYWSALSIVVLEHSTISNVAIHSLHSTEVLLLTSFHWGTKIQNKSTKGTWVKEQLSSWVAGECKRPSYSHAWCTCENREKHTWEMDPRSQPGSCGCGGKTGIYWPVRAPLHSGRYTVSGYQGFSDDLFG